MKNHPGICAFGLLAATTVAAQAQTITTPPRALQSMPETSGMDSTFQGNVRPNLSNSTITLTRSSAPAPAPAPPPLPASSLTVCASHGGMPYTITPVLIKSGAFGAANVATINGYTTSRWTATGSYNATLSFNGATVAVSDTCTRTNSTDGAGTADACDHSTTWAVGGGTFVIAGSYTSPVAQDWVFGKPAPYAGQGTVTQINCR